MLFVCALINLKRKMKKKVKWLLDLTSFLKVKTAATFDFR